MKRFFIALIVSVVVIVSGIFYITSRDSLTPILMYHSVNDSKIHYTPTVTVAAFETHLAFLNKHNFKVISLDEYVKAVKSKGRNLPYKAVVVTFDDGYRDNFSYAYPLLKRYRMPSMIFVPTDFLGKDGYVTLDDIQVMMKHDISIGVHGKTHAYLPTVVLEDLYEETTGAKKDIEKMLGKPVSLFCYPIGGYSQAIKEEVEKAGYKAACTTNRSPSILNTDIYALNRIKMTNKDTYDLILWGKTSRVYNLMRNIRNHFRNTGKK